MPPKQVNAKAIFQSCAPVETADGQIEALLADIQQLKGELGDKNELEKQIDRLREELRNNGGTQKIPIELIFPNPEQPRKTFSHRTIGELARNMARYGQLDPVILIPQSNGTYIIFDGECRWQSAQANQWSELDSVLTPPLDNKDLQTKALITTIFREDLNALDRAEAILNNIEMTTEIPINDAESLIKSVIYRLNRQKNTVKLVDNLGRSEYNFDGLDLSESEIKVITILLDFKINPASFCSQDLKALHLPDDLKSAIRKDGLQIQHSFHLNRLNEKNLRSTESVATKTRKKATASILEKNLSVRETATYVSSLLSQTKDNSKNQRQHPKLSVFLSANRKIINILTADLPYDVLVEMQSEIESCLEKLQTKLQKIDSNP